MQRSAQLTCVREEFAGLWSEVTGTAWRTPPLTPPEASGGGQSTNNPEVSGGGLLPVVDEAGRQKLRNEIDAIVAHLYGLSRDEFAHILSTFPLVFPDDDTGKSKKEALLKEYDSWQSRVKDWSRE